MILHTDNMIIWLHFSKAAIIVAETSREERAALHLKAVLSAKSLFLVLFSELLLCHFECQPLFN